MLAPLRSEGSTLSSVTLPKSGMMRNGTVYELPTSVPRTSESVSGLWPTPNAIDAANDTNVLKSSDGRSTPNKLGWAVAVELVPTPTASDCNQGGSFSGREGGPNLRGYVERSGSRGPLNPPWVEWLMGFPEGHTAYER
jgi:hypothetical protein